MSHYATLKDYRFEDGVTDIRGAKLYGEGEQELGRVRDVVFEHNTGDIRYLVVEYGHDRRVLLPLDRLFRSVLDEDSFSSNLTRDDLDHLPSFDEKVLGNDRQWNDYEKLHRSAMKERAKTARQEYKRNWRDDPVQHMDDDVAHNVTPIEAGQASGSNVKTVDRQRSDDYVPDVWPERLAPVFTATEQTSDKLSMVPQGASSRTPAAEYITAGFGPQWKDFAERLQRDLPRIRGGCPRCAAELDSRAA